MKKIGFIDFYLSEWHANNYPAWIEQACHETGLSYRLAYAWGEQDISPVDGRRSAEWCRAFGAELCASIEEVCEKSDVLLILAPSNPEKHLPYAEKVLPYGKPTYIDKTFAPDRATAEKIFALAARYHTPFFSTSAMRYAEELAPLSGAKKLITTGGGYTVEEYLIHQAEMIVSLWKAPAERACVYRQGMQDVCLLEGPDGRQATVIFAEKTPYTVSAELPDGTPRYAPIASPYFTHLLADILRFYESGKPGFDGNETLWVMGMRDLILRARQTPGAWVAAE